SACSSRCGAGSGSTADQASAKISDERAGAVLSTAEGGDGARRARAPRPRVPASGGATDGDEAALRRATVARPVAFGGGGGAATVVRRRPGGPRSPPLRASRAGGVAARVPDRCGAFARPPPAAFVDGVRVEAAAIERAPRGTACPRAPARV